MLAIANPIGLVPFWSELMSDTSKKVRKQVALLTTLSATAILLLFLNGSQMVMRFFSIDIPVFKVAGGLLLLQTAFSMVKGQATRLDERDEEGETYFEISKKRFRKVIVPLVVPMLSGPGTITTVVLYGSRAGNMMDNVGMSVILVGTMFLLFLIFAFSHFLEKNIDNLVFVVMTRILGIIVAAIAMQFMLEGLGAIFPNWLEGQSTFDDPNSYGAKDNP